MTRDLATSPATPGAISAAATASFAATALASSHREFAAEHRKAPHDGSLQLRQQPVAPVEGGPQRPVPRRRGAAPSVSRCSRVVKARGEAFHAERRGGHAASSMARGNAVEAAADLGRRHRRAGVEPQPRLSRAGARDEEFCGAVLQEVGDLFGVLRRDVQGRHPIDPLAIARRGCWLVATICNDGLVCSSASATSAAAPIRCSQLSSRISLRAGPSAAARLPGEPASPDCSSAAAIAGSTRAGSDKGSHLDEPGPAVELRAQPPASSTASRVLPTPPRADQVTSRFAETSASTSPR